jgi:hypothetical protein
MPFDGKFARRVDNDLETIKGINEPTAQSVMAAYHLVETGFKASPAYALDHSDSHENELCAAVFLMQAV